MPADNAKRAIQRGTGEIAGANYEDVRYEGYGPHGIAIIIDALTDNRNRTVATLRRLFSSHEGTLGETGTVNWMFKQSGVIRTKKVHDEDSLLELLLDFVIDDISCDDEACTIICSLKELEVVRQHLIKSNIDVESAELEWVAKDKIDLPDAKAEQVVALLTELDDHDDVQHVYTNLA